MLFPVVSLLQKTARRITRACRCHPGFNNIKKTPEFFDGISGVFYLEYNVPIPEYNTCTCLFVMQPRLLGQKGFVIFYYVGIGYATVDRADCGTLRFLMEADALRAFI